MKSYLQKPGMLFLVLALITITGTLLFAAATGSIEGTISDGGSGSGIPFARITLTGEALKKPVSIGADYEGKFVFKELLPGSYEVEVTSVGYVKKYEKNIIVSAGKVTRVNLKLKPSSVTLEEVQIKSKDQPAREPVERETRPKQESGKNYKRTYADEAAPALYNAESRSQDFNTEQYDYLPENDFHEALRTPLSTFSIDVDGASYANIRRYINNGSLPPVDAVRVEEMINYFKYDYPQPTGQDPFSINSEVAVCPWNNSHQLISIGLQGRKVDLEKLPPSNLVFLIDVSGSMMPANKLPLLKNALVMLTGQLRKQDRVAIVVYAGSAGLVLPSTPGDDKETILAALESLQAGGSTAGGAGIQLAYKTALQYFMPNGNNRVILATDGDFNVGVSSDGDLVRIIEEKREKGVFLTVLGFGTGNLKDSRMEKLANKGNGNYAYIDNILEAKKVLVSEMGGTLYTIAKDVKIQVEFNPEYVKAYKLIGYENRLLQDRDFNDDKKDAGELGSGHTVTALYEIIPAGSNETVGSIDPLKYQNPRNNTSGINELLTVKFRYKDPDGSVSKLITRSLKNKTVKFDNASENLRFAAAVAEFGLVLRNSPFKGTASFDQVASLARSAKGNDHEGYRSEFIRLVEMASLLKQNPTSGK